MNFDTFEGQSISAMPCCGVYAIAMAAGMPFDVVFNEARRVLKKTKAWKGRTTYAEREKLLNHFSVKFKSLKKGPKTLRAFAEDTGHLNRVYIVHISKHILHVSGGFIADQTGIHHFSAYKKRNGHVKQVLQIL